MTIGDGEDVRRTSVGTKVLMVACGVLAVLGSFWTIVWFIRSYVEAPRITMAPMALAARETTPVALPASAPASGKTEQQPVATAPSVAAATQKAPTAAVLPAEPPVAGGIADRWMPMTPPAPAPLPEPPPAAATQTISPAALTAPAADNEPAAEEVAEGSVPAIAGPAPLPRRKPTQTAAVRSRNADPPLPRPRPDGPAPQSLWTAVPSSDDRFPQQ